MKSMINKIFGELDLTWPKLIAAAVISGVFTAVMAIIPALRYTSFNAITVTFEVWVLFGIIIIMNSRSNIDSALKCFVFFLISQPLVYLIQVPFSKMGWGLFGYYRYWFIWTILCLPMGFVGHFMKKKKWWGYLILLPMIALTASSYFRYFSDFMFYRPYYLLITLFCIGAMIIYPLAILEGKKLQTAGVAISGVIIIAMTAICLIKPPVYSTEIFGNNDEHKFDNTYSVYLEDPKYGDVDIRYIDGVEDYMVHAEFKKAGDTVLTLESPTGETRSFDLHIKRNTYEIKER